MDRPNKNITATNVLCSFIAFGRIPKFREVVQFGFSRTVSSEVVQNHLNMADVETSNLVRSIENSNLTKLWKQHKFPEQYPSNFGLFAIRLHKLKTSSD